VISDVSFVAVTLGLLFEATRNHRREIAPAETSEKGRVGKVPRDTKPLDRSVHAELPHTAPHS
jgi:hypothetical protein